MNKENKFEYLTAWCEDYHKRTNLKVHPSSVPVDVVLDDLMGQVIASARHIRIITATLEGITERFERVDSDMFGLKAEWMKLDAILSSLAEQKLTKETKKVDKKEVKK